MRPGRLDRILYVSPPDAAARIEILRVNFRRMAVNEDVVITALAEMASRPALQWFARLIVCIDRPRAALGRRSYLSVRMRRSTL